MRRGVRVAERTGRGFGVAFLVALTVGLVAANDARADRRIFGYTYPYMTLPEGGFELEHYLDARFQKMDDPSTPNEIEDDFEVDWEHQVEAEYGITDHWDFGFYNVFRQKPFESFEFRGVKLRSRYRFAEQGELFIDPAVYLEVAYKFDEVEVEQRLILGKMFGPVEVALNLKLEQEFKLEDNEFELGFNPTLGVGYHFDEHWSLALEYYGDMKVEHGEVEHFTSYLGPALSVAGKHFWWTIAVQPQLGTNDDRPTFQVRSLFAVVF